MWKIIEWVISWRKSLVSESTLNEFNVWIKVVQMSFNEFKKAVDLYSFLTRRLHNTALPLWKTLIILLWKINENVGFGIQFYTEDEETLKEYIRLEIQSILKNKLLAVWTPLYLSSCQ